MRDDEVLERFRRTGALLEGHFVLTSGLHSTSYLQSALVLQYPAKAEAFGRPPRQRFEGKNRDCRRPATAVSSSAGDGARSRRALAVD